MHLINNNIKIKIINWDGSDRCPLCGKRGAMKGYCSYCGWTAN